MGERDVEALLRLGGILCVVAAVRLAAVVAQGPPSPPPSTPDQLDLLLEQTDSAVAEADRRRRPLEQGERIPVNRADEGELDRLPRVGPALARAIVEERDRGGRFEGPEGLIRVRGVGRATADRLTPYLDFVGGKAAVSAGAPKAASRVSLSGATAVELQSLPGIGPALADRIVAARRARAFRTLEDLMVVPGIGPATIARLRDRVKIP